MKNADVIDAFLNRSGRSVHSRTLEYDAVKTAIYSYSLRYGFYRGDTVHIYNYTATRGRYMGVFISRRTSTHILGTMRHMKNKNIPFVIVYPSYENEGFKQYLKIDDIQKTCVLPPVLLDIVKSYLDLTYIIFDKP